jgi:cytochrome c oxidase subunit 4
MENDEETYHQPTGYGIYVVTWVTLLVLTSITVAMAGMSFGKLSVLVALAIAMIKSGIVLNYFMHLKYEGKFFHVILGVVIGALIIFIGLTFTDVLFR